MPISKQVGSLLLRGDFGRVQAVMDAYLFAFPFPPPPSPTPFWAFPRYLPPFLPSSASGRLQTLSWLGLL